MDDQPPTTLPPSSPNLIDVLIICWVMIAVVALSGPLWSRWFGKAGYLVTEMVLLLFGWSYLSLRGLRPATAFRWRPVPRRIRLPCLVMSVAAAVLLDECDRLVGLVIPVPLEQIKQLQTAFTPGTFGEGFWIVLGVVLAAPLVEESLFRGFIQQTFELRRDVTKAVLITSLLFAFIHLQPWWMIQLLIISVFLGYLSWRWGSILPGVAVHAVNNLWSLVFISGLHSKVLKYYLWKGHINPVLIGISAYLFWVSFRAVDRIGRIRDSGT